MKMPSSRPEHLLQRVAEQEDQQQQQRQLRQAQEEVGHPHQRRVDPAADMPAMAPITRPR
jgi:hypothetical protein